MAKLFPIILAGGSGTRLWPLSRENHPKPLLNLFSTTTMLQATVNRLVGLPDIAPPVLICNQAYRFLVAEQIRQLGIEPTRILLEPIGQNTAPALTITALYLEQNAPNSLMLVLPADHLIQDKPAFQQVVQQAIPLAEQGDIITFGIVPDRPETGYGYIQVDEDQRVARFVEKPDRVTAEGYLKSGNYLWNSGMFLLSPSVWLQELARFRPDILDPCQQAFERAKQEQDFIWLESTCFESCPAESIDYAVMEKTNCARVLPLAVGWSDVGSWLAVWQNSQTDENGNAVQGDVFSLDNRGCLLKSESRFVAAIGLDNVIVVETPDAVLVVNKSHAQDVKQVVGYLKGANFDLI